MSLLQTSSRPRGDVGGSFASRRGHGSQLSISDPSHHVTEAIGTMYGDDEDSGAEDNRPLSFLGAPYGADRLEKSQKPGEPGEERLRLVRTISDQSGTANGPPSGAGLKKTHTLPARIPNERSASFEGQKSPLPPLSPNPSLREGSQFALTNIDNPNDIAQELSNLQALRRLSMDVGNNSDPDLIPFSGLSLVAMPTLAPTGDDDEADPSRLLWVPARVHPELEPTAFKNFLENRVQSMKRRSGDSLLSVEGSQRNNSMSSLRRKKSMLSRQIHSGGDGGEGYVDGAERLNRQHSQSGHSELSIDELVADPTKAVQKLAQEAREEVGESDIIIPVAPGMGLRRSTRTTYRKGGSIRNGDRVPFSKRVANRQAEKTGEEVPPVPPVDAAVGAGLSRTKSEPSTENFSRPTRAVRRQHPFSRETQPAVESSDGAHDDIEFGETPSLTLTQLPVRTSSVTSQHPPVPQIIETPPQEPAPQPARPFPERSSSQKAAQPVYIDQYADQHAAEQYAEQPQHIEPPPARSNKRPSPGKPQSNNGVTQSTKEKPVQHEGVNINDLASRPMLPGSGGTTTTSLTFIPTMTADERRDRKSRDRDDAESISSTKSSGWKWFKSDDKEKKRREKEKDEQAKKGKVKPADNARLDVLQSSIDPAPVKGRESLLLDRDSVDHRLHEERKKESNRKASDSKKEKDGFFGGLFGGSKKKSDKELGHKKKDNRPLTPEPPPRFLRPDIDYPWTRFPIIEERAIYRMAHIKLANPRRPLQSQVLLSNFMYSYLAKVQAMHPQLQVPISPQQKRQEEERKRREAEQAQQQLELEQQMAQQQAAQDGNFDFEYHRSSENQYGDAPAHHDGNVQYVDDSQIYEYEHGVEQRDENGQKGHHQHNGAGVRHQQHSHDGSHGQGHDAAAQEGGAGGQYYYYGRDGKQQQYNENDERNDMW
ncbi:hypothetical protein B0T14DRAFT_498455 [Immersiella caudata]|uniref:Protein Zds1 C-terminal domain-containing protein n=1 Tax=Immersiella caudata TaxID=314043 RepID=A0AA39WL70_9PEZI|nr:hypothetical protein B0T14DRAFT_498455 [Immersiella caudata]